MGRVKKYIGFGILLLMTGCSVGVSTEPRVDMVNTTRINLINQINDVFKRGVRNSRFAKLKVARPAGFDPEFYSGNDAGLSAADSLRLIQEGLLEAPEPSKAPTPEKKKKKHKRFWIF